MKKSLLYILSACALVAGCVKPNAPEEKYTPEIVFSRTGTVELEVGIENAMTKATMTPTGEGRWEKGDEIIVACTDGTLVKLTLNGTGSTRRAFFKGEIPEGKTMGDYAFYPASAIKSFDGENVTFEMPSEINSTKGVCSVMAAKIEEGNPKIELKQFYAYMNVRLQNINNVTKTLLLSSDIALSGEVTANVDNAMTSGIPVAAGENAGIAFKFAGAPDKSLVVSIPVPAGIINSLKATTFTGKDKEMVKVELLAVPSITKRAATFDCEGKLPDWADKEPIPGTVLICDNYWAMGNLQYNAAGTTKAGFQDHWTLADKQWHYFSYDIAEAFNKNSKAYNGTTQRADIPATRDAYDHFNWGGIEDNFSYNNKFATRADGGVDICGKMFTDAELTTETKDFAAAKYGDLAFWASKGQYRMPTEAELSTLFEKANAQYGYVLIKDASGQQVKVNDVDLKVWGWLFTEPTDPRVVETTEREITETELTDGKGLFLPLGGRKANSSDTQVINTRCIALYWAGTTATISNPEYNSSKFSVSLNLKNGSYGFGYEHGTAYDRKSGFHIRPVYIPK